MAWTEKQQNAIDARNRSLIVSAAAGSGKTAVLVERIIQILMDEENQTPADTIVVVTFTNDAAAEIKIRLQDKLREQISLMPDNKWLLNQQMLLSKAKISTIHTFCYSIIREYLVDEKITSSFRILDETEAEIIKNNAVDTVLNNWNTNRNDDIMFLMDTLCNDGDENLAEMIVSFDEFLASVAFKDLWLNETEKRYSQQYDESFYKENILKKIDKETDNIKKAIDKALELSSAVSDKVYSIIIDDQEIFTDVIYCLRNEKEVKTHGFKRFSSPKKNISSPENIEYIKSIRNYYKEKILKTLIPLVNSYIFYGEEDYILQGRIFKLLKELYKDYTTVLWHEKQEKNALGFDDAEELVLKILCHVDEDGNIDESENLKKISSQYSMIMIDEFQDSNNKQDMIFRLLSNNHKYEYQIPEYGDNVFIVGDVKQSIYSFRQANPENFVRTVNSSSEYSIENTDTMQKIYLNKNFRSSADVIGFTNSLFSEVMSKECGDVVYNDDEKLYLGSCAFEDADKDKVDNKTEILYINPSDNSKDLTEETVVADIIKSMIDKKAIVYDKSGISRPCEPKDFCILIRKKKSATLFKKALAERGISVETESESGYLESKEMSVLINILKLINNPMLDTACTSVLMSSMFMFSSDDMLEVRMADRSGKIIQCINKIISDENKKIEVSDRVREKCVEFKKVFDELRKFAVYNNLTLLVQKIYEVTDYASIVGLYENGEKRRANLRLMYTYTSKYSENAGINASLSGFLRYIEKVEKCNANMQQSSSTEASNSVQIKTIHASKGLEFSFVFLVKTDSKFSNLDSKSNVLLSSDYDIGLKMYNKDNYTNWRSFSFDKILREKLDREKSEEMRLLYVALTRARQKLFITIKPSKKDIENMTSLKIQSEIFGKGEALNSCSSYKDWITSYIFKKTDFYDFDAIYSDNEILNYGDEECSFAIRTFTDSQNNNISDNSDEISDNYPEYETNNSEFEEVRKMLDKSDYDNKLSKTEARKTVSMIIEENKKESLVSEVQEIYQRPKEWKRPSFMMKKTALTGNEKGTAVHTFFQYLDFEKAQTDLASERKRLVENGFVNQKQNDAVSDEFVESFLSSKIYQKIKESDKEKVWREKQILVKINDILKIKDIDIMSNYKNTDTMLKGVIDLYFEDKDNNIILLDYKTDNLKKEEDFKSRYAQQVDIYSAALECITGKKVKEIYLYSFVLKKEIKIEN